jgi:Flp pilus assembly protein TadB
MRLFAIFLLLALAAPGLAAQQRTEAALSSEVARSAPALTPAVERAEPVRFETVEAEATMTESAHANAAQQSILDEHFLRSVLAGVVVTVISTLILRAIL